jgi:hypothetical protein
MSERVLRWVLIGLSGFLALTAIAGGIGLLSGAVAPPLEELAGSVFPDYTVPGLALMLVVGGLAAAATVLLLRRHRLAWAAAASAGAAIIGFEVVEVLVFGSPLGIARNLQVFYLGLGALLVALALWYRGRPSTS